MTINELVFTPEEVKKGLLNKFLEYVMDYNNKSSDSHIDLTMTTDGYCTIIRYVQNSTDDPVSLIFLDSDQVIYRSVRLPDNTLIDLLDDQDLIDEYLDQWLQSHPGWEKTEYGTWTNTIENKKFQEMLEGNSK